ncbi:MAG: aldehyde dehydrogenase family protein [Fimbriimonadales bacterium]
MKGEPNAPQPTRVVNPWTNELIGEIAYATPEEIDSAAANAWTSSRLEVSLEERTRLLATVADQIEAHAEPLAQSLVREIGKPIRFARAEVARTAHTFRLASLQGDLLAEQSVDVRYDARGTNFDVSYMRFPIGPVLGFVPYNWPYNLSAHKIAPAILTGCPIILKLSPLAPLSTLALVSLIHDCGVNKDQVRALHMTNEDATKLLTDDRIRMLSFTGSPAVGWSLKAKIPKKKALLELGGNAPIIIHSDADIEQAVAFTVSSGYAYAGQVCISAQNVLVQQQVFHKVRERLAAATEQCATGDPELPETICGPMINESAALRVRSLIDGAVREGARVVARAAAAEHSNLCPPTLLEAVPATNPAYCEEVFGPVMTIKSFGEFGEAITEANRSKFRLQASVFTSAEPLAKLAFEQLEFGGVVWNDSPSVRFDSMPYGGEGESGFGREGIQWAVDEMTYPRSFVRKKPEPKC